MKSGLNSLKDWITRYENAPLPLLSRHQQTVLLDIDLDTLVNEVFRN